MDEVIRKAMKGNTAEKMKSQLYPIFVSRVSVPMARAIPLNV